MRGSVSTPAVMVVASSRVVIVKLVMRTPQGSMVGAVLGTAVKAFLVRPVMPSFGPVMKPMVSRVITSVPVVVVVSKAWRGRQAQHQDSRREKQFANGHGVTSFTLCSAAN